MWRSWQSPTSSNKVPRACQEPDQSRLRGSAVGHLFLKPSTPPSYLHCVNAPTCTTIEYKSGTRPHIAGEGYSIIADFGDQYSDLLGGNAGHQVKIPSPMYYIP